MSSLWLIDDDSWFSAASTTGEIMGHDIDVLSCATLESLSVIENHERNTFGCATNTRDVAILACFRGKIGVHILDTSGNLKQYIEDTPQNIYGVKASLNGKYFAIYCSGLISTKANKFS